jgi:hypothetical protein
MKRLLTWIAAAVVLCVCAVGAGEKIKVVVVTGGHGFEHAPFFEVFKSFDDVEFVEANQKTDSELFEDISQWKYDVIVLYNMGQKISEARQANFLKLLDKGVGLVATHHCMGAYQGWPEYKKIIGAKYYLKAATEDGVQHPQSTYKHDVKFKVQVADTKHPITQGISDFEILDETYGKYAVEPDVKTLLTTDEPTCEKQIGWVKTYRKSPVCYLLLGHDSKAYKNENYRKLVGQAIRWAAGRLPEK